MSTLAIYISSGGCRSLENIRQMSYMHEATLFFGQCGSPMSNGKPGGKPSPCRELKTYQAYRFSPDWANSWCVLHDMGWIMKQRPHMKKTNENFDLSAFNLLSSYLTSIVIVPVTTDLCRRSVPWHNQPSNGSWRQGIKGTMPYTLYVAMWDSKCLALIAQ